MKSPRNRPRHRVLRVTGGVRHGRASKGWSWRQPEVSVGGAGSRDGRLRTPPKKDYCTRSTLDPRAMDAKLLTGTERRKAVLAELPEGYPHSFGTAVRCSMESAGVSSFRRTGRRNCSKPGSNRNAPARLLEIGQLPAGPG